MESLFAVSASTSLLLCAAAVVAVLFLADRARQARAAAKAKLLDSEFGDELPAPPGPHAWPIIGNLHLLAGYAVPYQAFTPLANRYGSVFKLSLGSAPCVVVNGLSNIKEVIVTKGAQFDGRPNFRRYHELFCGDKENSLAFCDWSAVQKARREMLRAHTFPRAMSARWTQLDSLLGVELDAVRSRLDAAGPGAAVEAKPLLLGACANVFTSYFCSKRFNPDDASFRDMIHNFDRIFDEVNQGYAADFLPWLLPLHSRHFATLAGWSHKIRDFMTNSILQERLDAWEHGKQSDATKDDYVEELIGHVRGNAEPAMSWDTAMFALEDIVGGHSAVGNLLIKVLGYVATHPEVQDRVHEEAVRAGVTKGKTVTLADRTLMPYTEGVVLEAIRLISSPIVPHVANQDSSIAGYKVEKDTLIFLNNYELNMSPALWTKPEEFMPERFVSPEGRLAKPEHFLPFGGGRRSCMGYKMVQYVSFATIANLLNEYRILPIQGRDYTVPIGNLALPWDSYQFHFERR